MSDVKITINNSLVSVPSGIPVIEACKSFEHEIPHFCYHKRLKIAGNCRMCLVDIGIGNGQSKLMISCHTMVADGMVISTNSENVIKAREGVMEFLLINHPLDCPVCDQGGQCDLQDQAYIYGKDHSRFDFSKRIPDEINMGPLIKTAMTRCIHCTRCIRFMDDVACTNELIAIRRGEDMAITTYNNVPLISELSGNIIDLCPVGALNAKPDAYQFRAWELKNIDTIDIMDAVGSNIVVGASDNKVRRIIPRVNNDINLEWISDRTRFACDGIYSNRIDRCYIKLNDKLEHNEYDYTLRVLANHINSVKSDEIACIVGDLVDVETCIALKFLLDKVGVKYYECRQDGAEIDASLRENYIFNTGISKISSATSLLLINVNPRVDAPIIDMRIAQAVKSGLKVHAIGDIGRMHYNVTNIGLSIDVLIDILNGDSQYEDILIGERPMLIIGQDAIIGEDGGMVMDLVLRIANKYCINDKIGWNGYNMLHKAAGRVGALDAGFYTNAKKNSIQHILEMSKNGEIKLLLLFGVDEIIPSINDACIAVYVGTHGDNGVNIADIIIPSACYTEKTATYVNTEGRLQRTNQVIKCIGDAKSDHEIVLDLAKEMGIKMNIDLQVLSQNIVIQSKLSNNIKQIDKSYKFKKHNKKFNQVSQNFYLTNYVLRSSKTMNICANQLS